MGYVVALYGSVARGDVDVDSDLDVLLIAEESDDLQGLREKAPPDASASEYTWDEIEAMRDYGSLFLHHLAKDAQVLDADAAGRHRFMSALRAVPAYSRGSRDVASFKIAISDCEDSVEAGFANLDFELSTLATVARHASIVGCALTGGAEFGRYNSVRTFCERRNLSSVIAEEFPTLYRYKREWNLDLRALPSTPGAGLDFEKWLPRVRILVEEVEQCV